MLVSVRKIYSIWVTLMITIINIYVENSFKNKISLHVSIKIFTSNTCFNQFTNFKLLNYLNISNSSSC